MLKTPCHMFYLGSPAHPRWCRDHCKIQPDCVQLHNRKNGVLWPWDVLADMWDSPGHSDFFLGFMTPKMKQVIVVKNIGTEFHTYRFTRSW